MFCKLCPKRRKKRGNGSFFLASCYEHSIRNETEWKELLTAARERSHGPRGLVGSAACKGNRVRETPIFEISPSSFGGRLHEPTVCEEVPALHVEVGLLGVSPVGRVPPERLLVLCDSVLGGSREEKTVLAVASKKLPMSSEY